jgi:hypothetical protein
MPTIITDDTSNIVTAHSLMVYRSTITYFSFPNLERDEIQLLREEHPDKTIV